MQFQKGGVAVAQEEEQSPANRKVYGSTSGHISVSLGKTLNPTLPPDASNGVWMCVND